MHSGRSTCGDGLILFRTMFRFPSELEGGDHLVGQATCLGPSATRVRLLLNIRLPRVCRQGFGSCVVDAFPSAAYNFCAGPRARWVVWRMAAVSTRWTPGRASLQPPIPREFG